MRESKDFYFKTTLPNFLKNDPTKFWNFLSDSKKQVSHILVDGNTVTDLKLIAEHFNKFFHSVFAKASLNTPQQKMFQPNEVDFISYSGVLAMILKLKTKSSCGPDNIPNVFLRRYAESIAHFVIVLFRCSLLSAKLPSDWKRARVVPVFKKGNHLLVENYRPISLTSPICKMLEHVISKRVVEFLEQNSILTNFQHGFRKGYSTVTQLVSVVHSFAETLDKNGQMDVIFLDFSKAFDKVIHHKLITKLRDINLPDIFITWIQHYLTERSQFVSVDGNNSSSLPVTSGVPQGSVLGPLLFLIYVNDIVNTVLPGTQIRLFADDCVLFRQITCSNDQQNLNLSLNNILNWCNDNGMALNAQKTVYLCVTRSKTPLHFTYNLGSSSLQQVNNYKYLGVTITNDLSWNLHIDNVCSAAFRKLCFLKHKLRNSPSNIKLLSYFTYIRPKLEYSCVVWDPFTKCNIRKLEAVQRKAVRFAYSKFKITDSPTELMTANNIETLELRRKRNRLNFLYLLVNHKLALDPHAYVSPLSTRHTRHHHAHSLTPYFAKTNAFQFSFFPRTVSEWNCLTDLSQFSVT